MNPTVLREVYILRDGKLVPLKVNSIPAKAVPHHAPRSNGSLHLQNAMQQASSAKPVDKPVVARALDTAEAKIAASHSFPLPAIVRKVTATNGSLSAYRRQVSLSYDITNVNGSTALEVSGHSINSVDSQKISKMPPLNRNERFHECQPICSPTQLDDSSRSPSLQQYTIGVSTSNIRGKKPLSASSLPKHQANDVAFPVSLDDTSNRSSTVMAHSSIEPTSFQNGSREPESTRVVDSSSADLTNNKRKQRTNWSVNDVFFMLELYGRLRKKAQYKTTRKLNLWIDVAKELNKQLDGLFSGQMCQDKFKSLGKEHRKRVDQESKTGAAALKPWPFSDVMHHLIGNDPAVVLDNIQEVGAGGHTDNRNPSNLADDVEEEDLPKQKRCRKTNAECIDAAIKMEQQKEKDRQSFQQEFLACFKDLLKDNAEKSSELRQNNVLLRQFAFAFMKKNGCDEPVD